ncbi:MAG: endonuclease V [Candidatus Thorarchaeota archaeon]|nr:MAG: endonuclease V [Candidatus Thorarchaeota archaeon]
MRNLNDVLAESETTQTELASQVSKSDQHEFEGLSLGGVDVAYCNEMAHACAVIFDIPTQSIVRREKVIVDCEFPYVPGHFYLREAPVILRLLDRFEKTMFLIDGNGVLHPRRMGLASYIGVKLDVPTIGIAKSLLHGKLSKREGNRAFITDNGETIGSAVWLPGKKKPIFVSIGHRVSLDTAIRVAKMSSVHGYPEPLRQAHLCANEMARVGSQ